MSTDDSRDGADGGADGGSTDGSTVSFAEYVRTLTGGDTQARIAVLVGTNKTTVWRWLHRDTIPDAQLVVRLARAYDDNPVGALVAAGYLTDAESKLRHSIIRTDLTYVPTSSLVAELARRTSPRDPESDAA